MGDAMAPAAILPIRLAVVGHEQAEASAARGESVKEDRKPAINICQRRRLGFPAVAYRPGEVMCVRRMRGRDVDEQQHLLRRGNALQPAEGGSDLVLGGVGS